MKIITTLTISLIMMVCFSCSNKQEKKQSVKAFTQHIKFVKDEKEITQLWKAALDSGNFEAYEKISLAYLLAYRETEVYYCSLIMANRYHCPQAYFMLHTLLTNDVSAGNMILVSKDKDTQNLALYYLFKAKELGSIQAKSEIEQRFGKTKPMPRSSFFLKQLMKP